MRGHACLSSAPYLGQDVNFEDSRHALHRSISHDIGRHSVESCQTPTSPTSTDNPHIDRKSTIPTQARIETCQKLPCQGRAEAGRSSGMHSASPAGLPPRIIHPAGMKQPTWQGPSDLYPPQEIHSASNALGRTLRPAVK